MESVVKESAQRHDGIKLLTAAFFGMGIVEVIAEYFSNTTLVYITKPLLIPILIVLYLKTIAKRNYLYLFALLFSWIANIFFISTAFQSIVIGAVFFLLHRLLMIVIVLKNIRFPSIFPMVVGCVPFLFIYLYLVNLTYDDLGNGLIIFIIQCVVISCLGGIAVGNYILRSDKPSSLLLISTLLFAVTQFVFVLRLYYTSEPIFQPVAMLLFVLAQFIFYRFLVTSETSPQDEN
ncbi:MAG TPA: lysoplasmalogenase family protein [Flavobacterium sp.]|jgi:uncharacterized membrane protein YhhN